MLESYSYKYKQASKCEIIHSKSENNKFILIWRNVTIYHMYNFIQKILGWDSRKEKKTSIQHWT